MPLTKPRDPDVSKLHSEINQYINQKFTVAMTAITISGVILGWMVTRDVSSQSHDRVIFFLSIILLAVLSVLFVVTQVINASMILIASYLRVTKASEWEMAYDRFNGEKRLRWVGQKQSICLIFLALGFLTGLTPTSIVWLCRGCKPWELGVSYWLHMSALAFYVGVIVLAWIGKILRFGDEAEAKWIELNESPPAERQEKRGTYAVLVG